MKVIGLLLFLLTHAVRPTASELTPAAIDAYVRQASSVPGMSVVVTHDGKVVHAAGYGHDSQGRPMTAGTPMRAASLSKSFTAMAVMTLVDQGKIALDEPVAAQLPEFRMADPRAAGITVRQLLNQTSGLSDTTVDIGATESVRSLRDLVGTLRAGALATDPGKRMEYCNVNYDVAARLVEVAAGQPFADYLKARVFGPLGMRGSGVDDGEVADGYNSIFGVWVSRPELPAFLNGTGSGGVVTTAADMGRWLISQTGHGRQLVTRASLDTMQTLPR